MKKMVERFVLRFSYLFFSIFPAKQQYSWVVGVDEMAKTLFCVAKALTNSYSVCLSGHSFYSLNYGFHWVPNTVWQRKLRRIIGPFLLGKLLHCTKGFVYIWDSGFLDSKFDGREYEFSFIKRKGKKIVCYFVGNDIRSPEKVIDFAEKNNIEMPANYYYLTAPFRLTKKYEKKIERTARVAEEYADMIFSSQIDQVSYFAKPIQNFQYLYPSEMFNKNVEKFSKFEKIRIVHAPSSPIIKGTQLVRAAIFRLLKEGKPIEYIELKNETNDEVLFELRRAHIALNEFYALVPGVFGIEAMASHCVLLTSADEHLEPSLPRGSNSAWIVTRCYEIYDKMLELIEKKQLIQNQADLGYQWAWENASIEVAGKRFEQKLNSLVT